MKRSARAALCALVVIAPVPLAAQEQFYSNGVAMNQWDSHPNETFNGQKGYYQTYFFKKVTPTDVFYGEHLARRSFHDPNKTYFWNEKTGLYDGYYDSREECYSRLAANHKHRRIADIRPQWFPKPEPMSLYQIWGDASAKPPADSPPLEPPPIGKSRIVRSSGDADDKLGPPPPPKAMPPNS